MKLIRHATEKDKNEVFALYEDTTINDRYFIVDSINKNYRMDSQEITLIEKK